MPYGRDTLAGLTRKRGKFPHDPVAVKAEPISKRHWTTGKADAGEEAFSQKTCLKTGAKSHEEWRSYQALPH